MKISLNNIKYVENWNKVEKAYDINIKYVKDSENSIL